MEEVNLHQLQVLRDALLWGEKRGIKEGKKE